MERITLETTKKAALMTAYEKEICSKKIVIRLKVENVKIPPPRRIKVNIRFDDGTSRIAEAVLVSAYTSYAYYDLSAADAREVYPHVNNIREIEIVEE
jgi:hypothetical protein